MDHPDIQAADAPVRSAMRRHESHALLSAYPLTREIIQQIARDQDMVASDTVCLGDLKRRSLIGIYRALREISADHVWIVISDRGFQPMLPVLILLAALTRGRKLHVADFSGNNHVVSRASILLREPIKLVWGSCHGLLCVWRAYREARSLAHSRRMPTACVPNHPRIAYFKTNLWLGVQAGGAVGHIAGVINGFARSDCAVEVFSGEEVPLLDPIVHFHRVSGSIFGGLPLETSGYQFHHLFCQRAREHLNKCPPDFVYQRNCLANFAGVVLAREFGVPLILEYNGSEAWVAQNWGTPLRFHKTAKLIEEINLHHAQLIIVVSRVLLEELLQRGIEKERILYYPNCIDPEVFNPDRFSEQDHEQLRDQWHIPRDAIVCTFLGTFGPWHGADVLAEAIREMASTRLRWLQQNKLHFMFVGSGQLLQKVRGILEDIPTALVTFTGLIPQSEAPGYLAASDILVSPHVANADGSRFFGSPTKLFEYMAMGKPIIASELEQLGEVLTGSWHIGRENQPRSSKSRAVLTTPGSSTEIAEAVIYLTTHPETRSMLGASARTEALNRYTWQKQITSVLKKMQLLSGAYNNASK
jgi:glycosyltransferase involved in cell wall biosynthesis